MKDILEISHTDALREAIQLAWKFVTLPNPLIVCQHTQFDYQVHDPEAKYWDEHKKELPLIYTRPVVYRNFEGRLACKGWVANTATSQLTDQKCILS